MKKRPGKGVAMIVVATLGWTISAHATPYADAGDMALRHDVQLLADAGRLHGPFTAWPISWPDLARDLHSNAAPTAPHLAAAYHRLLARVSAEARRDEVQWQVAAGAADEPVAHRGFARTPRETGALTVEASQLTARLAYRLRLTAATDAQDGKAARADGSFIAARLGNWSVGLSNAERWWGPGWEGSLILSNNARPIPALTLQRIYADPLSLPLLKHLGPMQFHFLTGVLDSQRSDVASPLYTAMRLSMRPTPALEIGLSRAAQWGGQGRDQSFQAFFDMLVGDDNQIGGSAEEQPGNQLAGYDARWQSPLFQLPYAVYAQLIGEDEADSLPIKFIGLGGVEIWGGWGESSWRGWLEYADTAVDFYQAPQFNIAYQHGVFKDGYTYRQRTMGHTVGGDGRSATVGGLWRAARGWTVAAAWQQLTTNRGTADIQDQRLARVQATWSLGGGRFTLGTQQMDKGTSSTWMGWEREF